MARLPSARSSAIHFAMKIPTEIYAEQAERWPSEGRHILAHHDAETIVVYQAYRPEIGKYAIEHGAYGGDFS